jgi:hypothetical protein
MKSTRAYKQRKRQKQRTASSTKGGAEQAPVDTTAAAATKNMPMPIATNKGNATATDAGDSGVSDLLSFIEEEKAR